MNVLKYSLLICLILNLSSFVFGKTDFCRGFEAGYITGYKKASGSSFDPFIPFCPFQPLKTFSDPQSNYEHGYLIGLEKGINEGSR